MIKIESNFDRESGKGSITYDCKETCTYEHLKLIEYLTRVVVDNDPNMEIDDIRNIIGNTLVEIKKELKKAKKEEKKNGKRNN